MPSAITQTIPTAASAESLVPQRQAPTRENQTASSPAQAILSSQLSSQNATIVAKSDKERAPQVPKRSEGGFASQEDDEKRRAKKRGSKDDTDPRALDIIA